MPPKGIMGAALQVTALLGTCPMAELGGANHHGPKQGCAHWGSSLCWTTFWIYGMKVVWTSCKLKRFPTRLLCSYCAHPVPRNGVGGTAPPSQLATWQKITIWANHGALQSHGLAAVQVKLWEEFLSEPWGLNIRNFPSIAQSTGVGTGLLKD